MKVLRSLLVMSFAALGLQCGADWSNASVEETTELAASCSQTAPSCDAPLPNVGRAGSFRHTSSWVAAHSGPSSHRARDLVIAEGADPWVLAKFAYGVGDADLKDEDVDVYLLRGCGNTWTRLGTYRTTDDGDHPTVHGVEDSGGRLYVNLRAQGFRSLEVGRHRLLMVVRGDLTITEQIIEVVRPTAKFVVTDIDGTLTESEYAAVTDVGGFMASAAHPNAAETLQQFAKNGYHIYYLTARPEWFGADTRAWLKKRGFPRGILHTTLSKVGATGSAAARYKLDDLLFLKKNTGIVPSYAFGNKDTDAQAYSAAGINPRYSYYIGLTSNLQGGWTFNRYSQVLHIAKGSPISCW